MYYYCIQFSLNGLGFNFGIDIFLAGAAETLAYFSISTCFVILDFFIGKVKRRQGIFVVNVASFVFGALYAFDFISKNLVIASIFICLCRMFNSNSLSYSQLTLRALFLSFRLSPSLTRSSHQAPA